MEMHCFTSLAERQRFPSGEAVLHLPFRETALPLCRGTASPYEIQCYPCAEIALPLSFREEALPLWKGNASSMETQCYPYGEAVLPLWRDNYYP